MKWSQFTIRKELDGEVLLFNTLNKALLSLDKYILKSIDNSVIKNPLEFFENEKYEEIIQVLIEEEFLLPNNCDEKNLFLSSLSSEWELHDALIVHFLPATGCNFNCVYCYQDGINRNYDMKVEDIPKISNYLRKYLELNSQINHLTITLHSGEPTSNWGIVPYAMNEFKKIAEDFSIMLNTSIVSNGYLLTPEKIEFLKYYNWFRFQVTLDGPQEVHDSRRHLTNGYGTFEKIRQNIKYILDNDILSFIDLRINYDQSNYEKVFELIDIINNQFGNKYILLSFGNITQTLESNAYKYVQDQKIPSSDFVNTYIRLYKYAHEKGFKLNDSYVFGSLCTAKMRNSFIFSPDGNLYKCLSMLGREQGVIGNWKKDICISPSIHYFNLELYNECFDKNCALIPICHCDCRFDSLINTDDFTGIYCRKKMLEELNSDILAIKYGDIDEK